jgi:hypothetical protein
MKFSGVLAVLSATLAHAAYPGDIVQYWVDQSAILVNGTVIGGLQSPPSGWFEAIVQGAVYLAATKSKNESLAFQQLAVSFAAHDTLLWTFHGTRNYAPVDASFRRVLEPIGIALNSSDGAKARKIGEAAAVKVARAREDDGIHHYYHYAALPPLPGNYQPRPGGPAIPDTPQAQHLRLFGGLGDVAKYRAPPPPRPNSTEFEEFLVQVFEQGGVNSTHRTAYDTETAWYWRESSPMYATQ